MTLEGTGAAADRTRLDRVAENVRAPWQGGLGRVALVLLVLQLLWRGVLLAKGYFTQDDFLMLWLAHHPVTLASLFQDYSGHLFPGGFAIAAAQVRLAPLDWATAVLVICALQILASAMAWVVLRRLLPTGLWAPLLFGLFVFSPLTLWSTQWWAVAIQFLPVTACAFIAVWGLLRGTQDGWRRGDAVALGAVVAALLFQERGLLVPLLLAAVALAEERGGVVGRVRAALTRHLRLWASLVVVLAAYLALHVLVAPVRGTGAQGSGGFWEILKNYFLRNLLPGLAGGPWSSHNVGGRFVTPPTGLGVVTGVALLAVAAWTIWIRRAAIIGWLLLLVFAVVNCALLFGGRTGNGPAYALVPRYTADVVPAFIVALALVVRVLPAAASVERTRRVVAVLSVAYLAAVIASTSALAPHYYNRHSRDFVENVRAGLSHDPRAVLYDGGVPEDVMLGWFGQDARLSTVVGVAPEEPVFDLPSGDLLGADHTGHLHRLGLVGTHQAPPNGDKRCGYKVTNDGVDIPFGGTIRGPRSVVRLGFYSGQEGVMTLTAGDHTYQVPVGTGLQSVDVVTHGSFSDAWLQAPEPMVVCVPAAEAGYALVDGTP